MSEILSYDNLIAGTQKPPVTRPGTVALGQSWSRGEFVGLLTSTLKWQLIDVAAYSSYSDIGIATEAIDTTSGETETDIFVEGEFAENAVIFGYSDDADDWREKAASHGIYLRKTVSVDGQ